jgi:hypothetical protein
LTDLDHRHLSELHELAAAAGVPRFRTLRRSELAAAINAALGSEVRSTEPAIERAHEDRNLYAVVRLDRGGKWMPAPKPDQVVIEKIVSSEVAAEREAEQLNTLAQSQQSGASYFWRAAPLDPADE